MASWGAVTVTVVLFVSAACVGDGDDRAHEIVFRVGATAGLSELVPRPNMSGSAVAASELVFELAADHLELVGVPGKRVVLKRRARSPYTTEQLAAAFRFPGLVSARALGSDRIEAVFKDEATGKLAVDPENLASLDIGQFRVESQVPGRVRLRRRGRGGIDVIEIVEVSSSDEWRKLMARELDAMPSSPSLFREQFAGMSSVRLLDIPAVRSVALYFNVRDPALADARVRRRIAAGLNRQAIARVASGDASTAAPPRRNGDEPDTALPDRLSLVTFESYSTMLLAASVTRHQLDQVHIAIEIVPLPLEQLVARMYSGGYQLMIGPEPLGERRFARYLSPGPNNPSMTGFSDKEYDAAVGGRDFAKAESILDQQVPATALYELRTFAAIDARFCGDVTPSFSSWRWMADLHPCEDGERRGEGNSTP